MFVLSVEEITDIFAVIVLLETVCITDCSICLFLYRMACKATLEPLESKQSHWVRIKYGFRKHNSHRPVGERNQVLTVKELHLIRKLH